MTPIAVEYLYTIVVVFGSLARSNFAAAGYRSLEAYVITERRATEDRAAIEASNLEHDRNEVRQRLQREAQKEREEAEKQEAEARRIAESEGQEAMPGIEPAAQQQNAAEPHAPTPPAENAIVEAPEADASPMIVDSTPEPPAPPPAEAEAPTESTTIPTTEETAPIVVDGTTDTVNTDQSVVRTATMSPTPSGRGSPSERKVPPPNDDFSLERIISDLKGGAAILGKDALSGRSIDWPHRVLFDPRAEGGAVCGFDISKDSQLVVGGYEDTKIRIWGYRFGDMIYLLKDHQDSVWTTKLSPDGTRLASGGADNKILLWDLTTGVNATVIRELVGHKQDVWIIAYSPTGKTLASGSVDTTVRIWDVETGDCLVTMGDHLTVILELSYNQDGSKLLSTSDMDAIIYDDSGDRLVDMKGHTGVIWCLQWSPDGRRVLSGSEDHTARVWSAETGEELVIIGEHSGPVWGAAFSPDGKKVVTGSYDSSVVVSDSFSAERIFQLRDRAAIINCVGFSRDGEFVVAGCANGSVKIWDAIDGEFIGELQGHKDKVKLVTFTADDNYIVSASDDGSVRFWSLVDILRL
ncbi:WD40-repeat-containing domain protein [Abortiporus biennis]|nr:WD40-repeat-containing domain protein [Abortiporus biennis]